MELDLVTLEVVDATLSVSLLEYAARPSVDGCLIFAGLLEVDGLPVLGTCAIKKRIHV